MPAQTDEFVGLPLKPPVMLPQVVPSTVCLRCEVCCRFPAPDSHLRPYFTEEEIAEAVIVGAPPTAFPNRRGSQVQLMADPQGEGYCCPMFDSATSHCRIYERRPLDCQLYPLAMMWNDSHDQVVLGWDQKCPFMGEQIPADIQRHVDRTLAMLEQPSIAEEIVWHPRLIGRFQEDVVVVAALPLVTAAVLARWGNVPLHRFTIDHVSRMQMALRRVDLGTQPLAAYFPAYHYIWDSLLAYWWTELQGAFCLFAQSADGWFMPLPPLGAKVLEPALDDAFELMDRWNGDTPVTRVENVSPEFAEGFRRAGYQLTPKESDYLYRVEEIAALAGDRFKSHRALCNRVEREQTVQLQPYEQADKAACRKLFHAWVGQKHAGTDEPFGNLLLADAESAHEIIWEQASALQLVGRVARIGGGIRAYTFGYWVTPTTFCVLVEVADRAIPGLAQYLFRDTCRQAMARGAEYINTMDDAGLAGLRASKEAYHPMVLAQSFIARVTRG